MKNFYIAGSIKDKRIAEWLSLILINNRFNMRSTYDWFLHVKDNSAIPENEASSIIDTELDAVSRADLFVLVLPGGRGSHVEFGVALAAKKKIIIYNEDSVNDMGCLAYRHESIHWAFDNMSFISKVEELMSMEV